MLALVDDGSDYKSSFGTVAAATALVFLILFSFVFFSSFVLRMRTTRYILNL